MTAQEQTGRAEQAPLHHPADDILAAFSTGTLSYPFAVTIAAHLALCDACAAETRAHAIAGGLVLEDLEPVAVEPGTRRAVLSMIEAEPERDTRPLLADDAVLPPPLAQILGGAAPRWRMVGPGIRQAILWRGDGGSLRLISVAAGRALPDHTHAGLEMTLALEGHFLDHVETYGRGDMQIADKGIDHAPVAASGGRCLCAVASESAVRYRGLVPRLIQPLLGI